jgi:hypothetical protein
MYQRLVATRNPSSKATTTVFMRPRINTRHDCPKRSGSFERTRQR